MRFKKFLCETIKDLSSCLDRAIVETDATDLMYDRDADPSGLDLSEIDREHFSGAFHLFDLKTRDGKHVQLTSLKGLPKVVVGNVYIRAHSITTLEGLPEVVEGEARSESS